jgi:rieske iron-sulfur protein
MSGNRSCACCENSTNRRALIKGGLTAGAGLALAPGLSQAQEAADPKSLRPREGDFIIRDGDATATPLTPADIKLHSEQTFAWSMAPEGAIVRDGSGLNALVLLRYEPSELSPETLARAADGVVAYTQICTHNGCGVGDWIADQRVIQCGCHFTIFDPKDSGKILEGPAPRALPALPLKVVDGKLVVAGGYTEPVGFDNA